MKPFTQASNSAMADPPAVRRSGEAAEMCAGLLLETAPLIMGTMRRLISASDSVTLTVQQFRALIYLQRHGKASLSETAAFLNLALPSTSKLVDQLVRRGLLKRDNDVMDRRKMVLYMTPRGVARLSEAQAEIRRRLAGILESLNEGQLAALSGALAQMRQSLPCACRERSRKIQPKAIEAGQ